MGENDVTKAELIRLDRDSMSRSTVSLEKYIDIRFEALVRETKIALDAAEHRLKVLNEFRDTVEKILDENVGKPECLANRQVINAELRRQDDILKSLELYRATIDGKASRTEMLVTRIIGLGGLVLAVAALVMEMARR